MRSKIIALAIFSFALLACSHQTSLQPANLTAHTLVRQTGSVPVQWRQFYCGNPYCTSYPNIVSVGGNLWYEDFAGSSLTEMNMTGGTSTFPLKNSMEPTALTVGSDGKLYAGSAVAAVIQVMTTAGSATQFTIPSGDDVAYYGSMTLGPDKNVWFAEKAHVGMITTGGTIKEFPYKDAASSNYYGAITAGPDGNLWVTEYSTGVVDKINTSGVQQAQYTLGCTPQGGIISAGGFVWINCGTDLAQVTTAGVVTLYFNGLGINQSGNALAVGPDGNPWFALNNDSSIGEFNMKTNTFTFYFPPANYATDYTLTTGSDGNVWAVDSSSHVNVYILNVISVAPTSLSFATPTSAAQKVVVTQKGTTSWTAVSKNTAIATVAQGTPANTFTVTPKAKGVTKIVVSDAKGNSFAVTVNVL